MRDATSWEGGNGGVGMVSEAGGGDDRGRPGVISRSISMEVSRSTFILSSPWLPPFKSIRSVGLSPEERRSVLRRSTRSMSNASKVSVFSPVGGGDPRRSRLSLTPYAILRWTEAMNRRSDVGMEGVRLTEDLGPFPFTLFCSRGRFRGGCWRVSEGESWVGCSERG